MGHGEKILVIGRHASLLARVIELLDNQGYSAVGATTNEAAIDLFDQHPDVRAVVIGGGVDGDSRALFHREFVQRNPTVKIIDAHPQTVLSDLATALAQQQP